MDKISRFRFVSVAFLISVLCIVPVSILAQSVMEQCPSIVINEFVICESRGTEYDSDSVNNAHGVFTVTVSGNYISGQSYFYSVHHTASITHNSPFWYDAAYTWYSDQYDIDDYQDDITDDWSDSYDYNTSPYPTTAGTYMRVRVYWWIVLVATYYLDATIYAPAK